MSKCENLDHFNLSQKSSDWMRDGFKDCAASIKVMIHHPDAIFTGIPNPTHKKVDGFLPQLYSFCQGLGFIVLLIIYMRNKKEIDNAYSMRRGVGEPEGLFESI